MLVLTDLLLVFGVASFTAIAALLIVGTHRETPVVATSVMDEPMALLFDDGFLHHATQSALSAFAVSPGFHVWADLRDSLIDRFPDLPETPGSGELGSMTLTAFDQASPHQIDMSWRGDLCWVTLIEKDVSPTLQEHHAEPHDIAAMRRAVTANPDPEWHLDEDGKLIWHNSAFQALRQSVSTGGHPLFETPKDETAYRVTLPVGHQEDTGHFEVSSTRSDDVTVCRARAINALVAAEKAKRHFVQTLSKTFAHLPIGLAIFDKNGQLALFNPALVDLSGLSAPFLSRRPTILSFFDQMRENRQMPEPKNYSSWRHEIAVLITAANDGLYQETWTLEDGRTYSVQGRPHPDGAIAFLIEDISAEITLTRNFRKEVELGQALLDEVDEALVVFTSSGVLTFCNKKYRDMWDQNPEGAFADVTIYDSIGVWRAGCHDLPNRARIEQFIMSYEDQPSWSFPITLTDNRALLCEMCSLGAGSKLIRFRTARPIPISATPQAHEPAA